MNNQPNRNDTFVALVVSLLVLALIIVGIAVGISSHHKQAAEAKQLDAQQQALAASPYADPILKYLPYGDIGYSIDPSVKTINAKYTLVLTISVIFYGSDYNLSAAQQQALINQREQAALSYIRSKGFDPAKYHIEYSLPVR